MDLIRSNKTKYLLFLFILGSCAGSSELIHMSSRNISKSEIKITASGSLNPSVMPLCHENIDTITGTSDRIYGNYPLPMSPILSLHAMYGLTDYYETGLGADLSVIGLTLILNNKIGLTDFKNHDLKKKIGLSYYNKISYTKGFSGIAGSYAPNKKGHFEVGNYLLAGIFFKDYELIITPHIDYNYLMSDKQETYSVKEGRVTALCGNKSSLKSRITNNNLFFINYGLNLSLKTKNNFYYEAGLQYSDLQSALYEPILKSKFQWSIGVGYELYSNKGKIKSFQY